MDRNYIIKITETAPRVALRKESVDRNNIWIAPIDSIIESLSARRAWIEILLRGYYTWIDGCRSPQGERG